jgi:Putative transmembrane protein (PGPGW)
VTALVRLRERRVRHRQRPLAMRVLVALGGFATLLGGLALLVLPGPGIPLVAVGLGLLGLEFRWAEVALARALRHAERVRPSSTRQRIAGGAAVVGSAGVAAAGIALWGVPGF